MNFYGNPGSTYYSTPQYQQQQFTPNYFQSQMPQQYSSITGKLVESEDMAKLQEIPIGGYGVYPTTDMSKVIIKSYDRDGNIQYLNYALVKPVEEPKVDPYETKLNDIYLYIEKLDKKIDDIKPSSPTPPKKKFVEVEVDADE